MRIGYYLRVYKKLISINWTYLITYRGNFWGSILSSGIWATFHIAQTFLLTHKSSQFYSWTRMDMLLLIGTFTLIRGLTTVITGRGIDKLMDTIITGGLDSILLKPINSQFYASTVLINYSSFIRCILGFAVLVYAILTYHIPLTFMNMLGYLFFFFSGVILVYSIFFIAATILLWNPTLTNMKSLINYLFGLGRYPSETFANWGKIAFIALYPFIIYTIPGSRVFAGKLVTSDALHFLMTTFLVSIFSIVFWKYSLRKYTSANV